MAGSEHYGKIMARSFSDRRLHLAGAHLAASGLVNEELAVLTIVGTIAALNFQLLEDGDSGILPGTGREMVRVAAFCSPKMADALIAALRAGDLLVETTTEVDEGSVTGLRLRGFQSANERILSARKYERSKRKRPSGNRPATGRNPPDAGRQPAGKVQGSGSGSGSGSGREESPPTPPSGGVESSASPEGPNGNGPSRDPHAAAVYQVHGPDPKLWPYGPSAWARAVTRVRLAAVPPDAWLDWLKDHRDAGPDEAEGGIVQFLEEKRKADSRHLGDVARSRAVVDEAMGQRVTLLLGMEPEKREAWLNDAAEKARDEGARQRLEELRRRVSEGAA